MTIKFPRKIFLLIMPLFILLGTSFDASAEINWSGTYAGAMYSSSKLEAKASGSSASQSWGHAKLKLGKIINDYVSVEGQLGMTTNSDTNHGNLTVGIYARVGKDFGQYKLYGLAGLGGYHSYADGFDSVNESDFSYGVGLEIFGSKDTAITLEYVTIVDKSVDDVDLTFDTLGLGFTYYFTEDTSYFNKNRNKIRSIRY
jgi:hypothetical protein